MKALARILGILCTSTLLMAAMNVNAAQMKFSKVIVFGDSLTDIGNNQNGQADQAPVTNKNPDGSNGETWIQPFVRHLKADGLLMDSATTDVRPSVWYDESKEIKPGDSIDFAYSGDVTGGFYNKVQYMYHPPIGENNSCTFTPNPGAGDNELCGVYNRVYHYVQKYGVDPNALYVIWAGPNDIIQGLQPGIVKEISQGIDLNKAENDPAARVVVQGAIVHLAISAEELFAAGAQHVMIINLPNLGITPQGKFLDSIYGDLHQSEAAQHKVLTLFSFLTTQFNQNLATQLNKASKPVIQADINNLFTMTENGELGALQKDMKSFTPDFPAPPITINATTDVPWMELAIELPGTTPLVFSAGCCANQQEGPNYDPSKCQPDPNHTDMCSGAEAKIPDGDNHYYVFYDAIHPTICMHKYMARYFESYLQNMNDPSKTQEQYFDMYKSQNLCAAN